jgi:hypothetical protein
MLYDDHEEFSLLGYNGLQGITSQKTDLFIMLYDDQTVTTFNACYNYSLTINFPLGAETSGVILASGWQVSIFGKKTIPK